MNKNIERFIRYAKIDTQADENSLTVPSTEKQKDLSRLLVKELKELGLKDAYMDEYGVVYAHLDGEGEVIGLNAHVDTALEVTNAGVNPRIVEKWDGKDIILNDEYKISLEQFPFMKQVIGHDLVVTGGNTLLGADDKAGIAIIMGVLDYLNQNPDFKHHPLAIAFTVDEEIGRGPKYFSLEKMKADYAYTIDGGAVDHIDFENFNAQQLKVQITGVAVHPGEGINTLVNALQIQSEFICALPEKETPFYADEGYWHLNTANGSSEKTEFTAILRNFSREKLEQLDAKIYAVRDNLAKKYPTAKIEVSISEQYENMKKYVDKDPRPVIKAVEAMKRLGIEPKFTRIKGGTDGATFSKMGLVTPNLGTGSANHHGRFEFLSVQLFEKMIEIVLEIIKK
ncbi:MAG: peptidase T [Erysipelotrichaceae bacterium]|jgi:tripeptide aminopeptidase|nr:peptidase T [Erysipelotrichaceae bacterium]